MTTIKEYNRDEMLSRMLVEAGDNAKQEKIKQQIEIYFSKFKEYVEGGLLMQRSDQEYIPFSKTKFREELARYGSKPQKYWFHWLHANYPLYEEIKNGNKFSNKKYGELTMIKPYQFTDEQLRKIESGFTDVEFAETHLAHLTDESIKIFDTSIDMNSLNAYIKSNQSNDRNKVNQNHSKALDKNLSDAQRIARLAKIVYQFTGNYTIPQKINESNFGRQYLTGINLQSTSKIVRHAALGDCYEYDIENSVFAWKYNTAKQLDPSRKFPTTMHYLEYKKLIRQTLTKEVFNHYTEFNLKLIKQAITAIGFGAKGSANSWFMQDSNGNKSWHYGSLSEIIRDPEKLKKFLENEFIKNFLAEQREQNNLIYESFKGIDYICNNKELLKDNSSNLDKNRVISYLYQQTERAIMNDLVDYCNKNSIEVLLTCHDALYTKQRAPLVELKLIIRKFIPEFSNIGITEHKKYTFEDRDELKEHRETIAIQTLIAKGYTDINQNQVDYYVKRSENTHNPKFTKKSRSNEGHYAGNYTQPNYDDEDRDREIKLDSILYQVNQQKTLKLMQ